VANYTRRIVSFRDGLIVGDRPNIPSYAEPPAIAADGAAT
jgi:hypothetical protein